MPNIDPNLVSFDLPGAYNFFGGNVVKKRGIKTSGAQWISYFNQAATKDPGRFAYIQQLLFKSGYYGQSSPNYGHLTVVDQKAFTNYITGAAAAAGSTAKQPKPGQKGLTKTGFDVGSELESQAADAEAQGLNDQSRQRMPRPAQVVSTGANTFEQTGGKTLTQDLVNVFQDSLDQAPSPEETLKFVKNIQDTELYNQAASANTQDTAKLKAAGLQDQAEAAAEGAYNAGQSGGGGGVIESSNPNTTVQQENPQAVAEWIARTTHPERYNLKQIQKRMGDMASIITQTRPGGTATMWGGGR